MLFDSSFRKELGRNFSATLIVLVTIVMTVMLIRTLGQASVGRVNPSEVVLVLGFTVLSYLPTILTFSLFAAATGTLTRMYGQSEMVVWFSCGQSLFSFVRPLLRFGAPVLLIVALLALFAWPWTNLQIRELRDRYQGRADIERVAPGRFIESAAGKRVFFIDKDRDDPRTGTNIFITSSQHDREILVSAQKGHIASRDGAQFLVLNHGYRVETNAKDGTMRESEFDEYQNRITPQIAKHTENTAPRLIPTRTLVRERTPAYLAELSWRLGLVLAAFNCLFIALATARANPRAGRSTGLLFALVTFATYYNLMSAGQSWIGRSRIGLAVFMLALHGGIFVAALAWLAWRERSWRRRPPSASTAEASP